MVGRRDVVKCPKCGYSFSLSYSRAVACYNCRLSVLGDCGNVRCPKCGYEFPYKGSLYSFRHEYDVGRIG